MFWSQHLNRDNNGMEKVPFQKKKVKTIRNFGLYEARIQKLMLLKEICLLEVMTALCKKKYMVKKRLDFGRRLDIFPENKYINSD